MAWDDLPPDASWDSFPPPKQKQLGYKVPDSVKRLAEYVTTPVRGFRGIGVGAQKLMSGALSPMDLIPGKYPTASQGMKMIQNAPEALQRSSAATFPGYTPLPGEKLGAALGEATAMAGLTAPLAAVAPASTGLQMLADAGTGAGMTSIMDAAEEGRFHPLKTAGNAIFGASLPIIASKGFENLAAKTAGAAARVQSGVEAKAGERLFKDPGAFFSPTEATAGERLGAFRSSSGLKKIPKSVKETVSAEAGEARKYIANLENKYALSKLGRAEAPTASELLKGKQSLNKIIEATPFKQKSTRADLFELKNMVSDELEKSVPGDAAASKEFSRSALAGKFRKFLPVTKSGDISLTRTVGLPIMDAGTVKDLGMVATAPLIVAQSPFLAGAGITAAGATLKGAQKIIANPVSKVAVQSLVRTLTNKEIKERIKNAPGDTIEEKRENARKEAHQEGFTWPGKK